MKYATAAASLLLLTTVLLADPASSKSQLQQDLAATEQKIDLYPLSYYLSPKYHHFFQDKLPPLLQKKIDLTKQLAPTTYTTSLSYALDLVLLSQFDDTAAQTLHTLAASTKPAEARNGRAGESMAAFWKSPDPDSQSQILDALEADALKTPADPFYTDAFLHLLASTADDTTYLRIDNFISTKLRSPTALKYRARPNKLLHPLHITGNTVDHKPFSLDKWKGKVVLVDFWATWCPPCREELPHVVEVFNKYHADGLEIIGVSNDSDHTELTTFLKAHPEMTWPQLFAPTGRNGWNALSESFNVNSIPTTYLVDKAGNLRAVKSLSALEKLIPTLLAEAPPPPATKPHAATP